MAASSQNAGRSQVNRPCSCCRCNRNGRCLNCACCKEDRRCISCLPGKLARCENYGGSSGVDKNSSRLSSSNLSILASVPVSASEDDESFFESSAFDDSLPSFTTACAPDFIRDSIPGDSFLHSEDCCYEEVIHWKSFCLKYLLLNVVEFL